MRFSCIVHNRGRSQSPRDTEGRSQIEQVCREGQRRSFPCFSTSSSTFAREGIVDQPQSLFSSKYHSTSTWCIVSMTAHCSCCVRPGPARSHPDLRRLRPHSKLARGNITVQHMVGPGNSKQALPNAAVCPDPTGRRGVVKDSHRSEEPVMAWLEATDVGTACFVAFDSYFSSYAANHPSALREVSRTPTLLPSEALSFV